MTKMHPGTVTAHIINHTHWDREWFLTAIYTTEWVPRLIDRLLEIGADNPEFRYFFDGQTLVVEDLLTAYPEYRPKVTQLIADQTLTIGPYYCQPDWQLTSGELLIRNLDYGIQDAAAYGAAPRTGWMVDTFGHLSQSPQIHALAGVASIFVWRGMPQMVPYFTWQGADDSTMFAVNLFGGYRNLYGVTRAPDVAVARLQSELRKLAPYYPTADLPLFDGYDLEDNPEDPVTFFDGFAPEIGRQLVESTPTQFVATIRPKLSTLPTLTGELNSGKYGATFPGVYSARTYLKVMSRDCAHVLHRLAEPLATLAWLHGGAYDAAQYERWDRLLLQNNVHDCICGVSIDQVHEKMEDIYRKVFDGASADVEQSLATLLAEFAPGTYAVSTNPFAYPDAVITADGHSFAGDLNGVGVWPVQQLQSQGLQQQELGKSSFENDHYKLVIDETGRIFLNDGEICLRLYAEHGDTYSDERAEQLATMRAALPLRMEAVGVGSRIMFECHAAHGAVQLTANVTITTDVEPVLRWQIDLDTRGTNFSVELVYETGIAGQVFAGMPFDVVARVSADTDLLPRQLDPDLANVLLGQRELNAVRTFPFQEYIAISDGDRSAAVLAQGVNSYRATDDGTLAMTLRRSVEWLTKANLDDRVGDAGPFFYVPDARCERTVRHEIAFTVGDFDVQGMELQRRNAAFQNPPLIVEVSGGAGARTEWAWQQRDVPLSSLRVHNGAAVARWFNPTTQTADGILPKKIITVADTTRTPVGQTGNAHCRILNAPSWRVGDNRGLPAAAVIEALERLAVHSREQMESAETQLQTATDDERYRWQHKLYVHQREMLEYQLSARLNRLKLAQNGVVSADYLYQPDAQVADIGYQLNQLRIKRRIYDYVVAALAESAE